MSDRVLKQLKRGKQALGMMIEEHAPTVIKSFYRDFRRSPEFPISGFY
jgi:hypothetical protein